MLVYQGYRKTLEVSIKCYKQCLKDSSWEPVVAWKRSSSESFVARGSSAREILKESQGFPSQQGPRPFVYSISAKDLDGFCSCPKILRLV